MKEILGCASDSSISCRLLITYTITNQNQNA